MDWLQPFVYCPRKHSPDERSVPIVLPYSNPPRKGNPRPDWPKDGWQLRLICPQCGRPMLCRKTSVEWGSFRQKLQDRKGQAFWRAEVECNRAKCELRAKWHIPDSKHRSETEIASLLLAAIAQEECANGHPLDGANLLSIGTVTEV